MHKCPSCFSDLASCPTIPLTIESYQTTVVYEQIFADLLSPPISDASNDSATDDPELVRIALGHTLSTVRQSRELERQDVAQQGNVAQQYVNRVEYGSLGTTFAHYIAILDVYGMNVYELLQQSHQYMKSFAAQKDISGYPSARTMRWYLRQTTLIIQVEQAITQLQAKQVTITQDSVTAEIGVTQKPFSDFPQIRERIKQANIASQEAQQREEEQVLQQVQSAIEAFRATGQNMLLKTLCNQLGMSKFKLSQYPRVWQLIKQEITTVGRRYYSPEQEQQLLEHIQAIKDDLDHQGKPLTLRAVYSSLKCSQGYLNKFPRVQTYLDEHIPRRDPLFAESTSCREQEFLTRVQAAITTLREQKQQVTHKHICDLAGTSNETLYRYPAVRELLQAELDTNRGARAEQHAQREEALLMRVQQAVVTLQDQAEPITSVRVAHELNVAQSTLSSYPRIREWLAEQRTQQQREQREQREQHLVNQIKEIIAVSVAQNETLTQTELLARMGHSTFAVLRHHPAVREAMEEAMQALPAKERRLFSEEQIRADVHCAIEQLRDTDVPLSIERIAQAAHYSSPTMHKYPDIKAWIASQCADDRNRRRQQKEADLVAKVADAIAYLQETHQLITWGTIAHYLEMQPDWLADIGRRYPRIRELVNNARCQ
jgi:GGDEF domain-containing protein